MPRGYDCGAIEKKWQGIWDERRTFAVTEDPTRPKYYCLEMYPYPSGKIHMGHVRNYSIGDVVARYLAMRGYNVLHPMGWDAFGFPAENAAFEHGIHPAKWTRDNIAYMKSQLRRMGFSYDWDREVTCCEPAYYRWNQWFFLQMLERGLAYQKTAPVNWCERCQSVLSNEQAEGGVCWRHGDTPVVQRELTQWFFRITAYVEELLQDLETLSGWPERVRTMQRNWIGKSVGAEVDFALERGGSIRIFTTRPDTLFGATFMVLAPEHPLTLELAAGTPAGDGGGGVRRAHAARRPERPDGGDHRQGRGVHRRLRRQPADPRADSHLGGELHPDGVWHRGHHGGAGPRPAGFRHGPEVPAAHPGRDPAGRRAAPRRRLPGGGVRRRRPDGQLGVLHGHAEPGGAAGRLRPSGGAGDRRARGELPDPRLARLAPALLGDAHPGDLLRRVRGGAGPGA